MLTIKHLKKTYKGGKTAIDDINIHVEAGDIYGFIGHNGADKMGTSTSYVCSIYDHFYYSIYKDWNGRNYS